VHPGLYVVRVSVDQHLYTRRVVALP
jgi:hypothetical protein